jgi:hypothetical protein
VVEEDKWHPKAGPDQMAVSVATMSDEALMERGICPICHVPFDGGEPESCPSCGSSLPPELSVARFSPLDLEAWKAAATGMVGVIMWLGAWLAVVAGAVAVAEVFFPASSITVAIIVNVVGVGTYALGGWAFQRLHPAAQENRRLSDILDGKEPKQLDSEE